MQKIDPFYPLESVRIGAQPLFIKVVAQVSNEHMHGVVANTKKVEDYILLSALPKELQEKVVLAIQLLTSGV